MARRNAAAAAADVAMAAARDGSDLLPSMMQCAPHHYVPTAAALQQLRSDTLQFSFHSRLHCIGLHRRRF